ncbi:MAG: ABC transporter permease [Sphingomonadaceae bacterium]
MGTLEAAYVVARRDFQATVFSRSFLFFLLAPALFLGLMYVFGQLGERQGLEDARTVVAMVGSEEDYGAVGEAHAMLADALGEDEVFELVHYYPARDLETQVEELIASTDEPVEAVLVGGIKSPRLVGSISRDGWIQGQMRLILDEVRQRQRTGGASPAPVAIDITSLERSGGSIASERALTARAGQFVIFFLTLLLATMLLSNLVEEKSNKIIEIIAAAVPIDAIFLGKLFAMLAMSLVGIVAWGSVIVLALTLFVALGVELPSPAVGWPFFMILVLVYYSTNYLLLGALFLGIGAQATSVREVQTISMPVTMGQMLLFALAAFAVGQHDETIGLVAAIFPLSSPLAMIARGAEQPDILQHLMGIAWQLLWVWIIVRFSAALFRRTVMKSAAAPRKKRRRFAKSG